MNIRGATMLECRYIFLLGFLKNLFFCCGVEDDEEPRLINIF
jgi:hypothetical protein